LKPGVFREDFVIFRGVRDQSCRHHRSALRPGSKHFG
jgi:hypothetical protein